MGQSRLGFLFSFTLWRELTHSSLIFSSRLFVSQITTKAPSFWAAAALLLLPIQIMLLQALSSWESCFSGETCHGQPASHGQKHSSSMRPHMFSMLYCSGQLLWRLAPDVKVGRDSLGHFLIDFNHNRLACWVSSTCPVLFPTSTRGTCKNTVTVTPFPLSLTPESHMVPPLVTVVRTLFCE